jgi:hypothetical protein
MHYDAYGRPMGFGATPGAQPPGTPRMGAPDAVPSAGMPAPANAQRVGPGALVQYYSDLASGAIVPEDMRLEDLQFRVQIDPTGAITFQTPAIMLISRYQFALRRIMGFAMDPEFAGTALSLVSFQVREQGRNFDIFKRPISLASIIGTSGPGKPAEWDGVYISVPGTEIEVNWVVDTARWPALVGATKEFGVQLMGDYTACTPA